MKKAACLLLALSLLLAQAPSWAEETPTDVPAAEQTPQSAETTEETPLPEDTPPAETPLPEDTPVPEATNEPEQTAEPEPPAQQTQEPTQSDAPEATPEPEWDEAWLYAGEEQTIVCGSLYDLVQGLEQETEVYLRTDEVICLEQVNVQRLLRAQLLLDTDYFTDVRWVLCVSEDDPTVCEAPLAFDPEAYADAAPEDQLTVYVWAALRVEETASPTPEETPNPEETAEPTPEESASPAPGETPALTVDAQDYAAGEWSGRLPVFHLSGIPEGAQGYAYAVVVYDRGITILSGDTYEPTEEGEYTVRLALLDEMGDVVSASESYQLKLDLTLPQLMVETDMETPYTMHLTASDGGSGLAGFSLDGGETWQELPEEGVFTLTASEKTVIAAGMIQARDLAGNTAVWEEEVTLEKISYGGGGGGGGGGGQKPAPHAPSTVKSDANYNAVGLKLSEEPMHTLVMEGEELELTLDVAAAEGLTIPEDYEAQFALSLDSWAQREVDEEGTETLVRDEEHPDVLILSVLIDAESERYTLEWTFNGAALRTLYNSGLNYLVLQAGDDWTVLPTENFLAGTRYAELKMNGVSTRRFDFTLRMEVDHTEKTDEERVAQQEAAHPNWLFTDSCTVSIETRVEGEAWSLPLGEEAEMYAENVFCGPADMLEVPYGEYTMKEEAK